MLVGCEMRHVSKYICNPFLVSLDFERSRALACVFWRVRASVVHASWASVSMSSWFVVIDAEGLLIQASENNKVVIGAKEELLLLMLGLMLGLVPLLMLELLELLELLVLVLALCFLHSAIMSSRLLKMSVLLCLVEESSNSMNPLDTIGTVTMFLVSFPSIC